MKLLLHLKVGVFLLWFFAVSQTHAQSNTQQWVQYYQNVDLSEKLGVMSDAGMRFQDYNTFSTYLIRSGLYYNANSNIKLGLGVAYFGTMNEGERSMGEFRVFQDAIAKQEAGRVEISHRGRVEERFFTIYNPFGTSSYNTVRLRYRLLTRIPLHNPSSDAQTRWDAMLGGELFFTVASSLNDQPLFDQKRFLGGLAVTVNPKLELSLLYNYQGVSSVFSTTYDHVFWLGIKHQLKKMENP